VDDENDEGSEDQDEGWPMVFRFPSPPTTLAEALKKKDPEFGKPGRSKLRTKLVNYLHQSITRYTL